MNGRRSLIGVAVSLGLVAVGCADADNPTALAELEPVTEFEFDVERVETLEEVEVHVHVMEGGSPLGMRDAQLEVRHEAAEESRIIAMVSEEHSFAGHVTFFEPGEHHVHFMGTVNGHRLMHELGEHEIEVHRRHAVIGPYWIELGISPAPVLEGMSSHIHVYAYEMTADGEKGAAASGLEIHAAVHDPSGTESSLTVDEEEAGEYEASFSFGEAGIYEMHVEVEVAEGEHAEGEFHIPVLTEAGDEDAGHDDGDDEGGDHGHDH